MASARTSSRVYSEPIPTTELPLILSLSLSVSPPLSLSLADMEQPFG